MGPLAPRLYLAVGGIFSAIVMAGIVDVVARGEHRAVQWLTMGWLMQIGKISYGLYVLHRFAQFAVKHWFMDSLPYPALVVCATAGSFALAGASWFLIERPLLRLKRYLAYAS